MGANPKLKKVKLTVQDIASAYNKHKGSLRAIESVLCCNRGTQLVVMNEMVVLRKLLEDLGFEDVEIDPNIYFQKSDV